VIYTLHYEGVEFMSAPANCNGAKPMLDLANAGMLLIDHQGGLLSNLQFVTWD